MEERGKQVIPLDCDKRSRGISYLVGVSGRIPIDRLTFDLLNKIYWGIYIDLRMQKILYSNANVFLFNCWLHETGYLAFQS